MGSSTNSLPQGFNQGDEIVCRPGHIFQDATQQKELHLFCTNNFGRGALGILAAPLSQHKLQTLLNQETVILTVLDFDADANRLILASPARLHNLRRIAQKQGGAARALVTRQLAKGVAVVIDLVPSVVPNVVAQPGEYVDVSIDAVDTRKGLLTLRSTN